MYNCIYHTKMMYQLGDNCIQKFHLDYPSHRLSNFGQIEKETVRGPY